MKKYRVIVKLKPNVLDPEGNTIQQASAQLGFSGIQSLRVGKIFEIEVEDTFSKEQIELLAKKLLINPITQVFEIQE